MALDFVVIWFLGRAGLLFVFVGLLIPSLLWRAILGPAYPRVGVSPLAFAYLAALVGLILVSFGTSYLEFSSRVDNHLLDEGERWSIVPGWTIYMGVLQLLMAIPALAIFCVPLAALLVRVQRVSLRYIVVVVVLGWILCIAFLWLSPTNQWHRTHRLESVKWHAIETSPMIFLVALPFFVSLWLWLRHHGDDRSHPQPTRDQGV
ncbi:MAG: hypothetical protein U1E67_00120 [Hyphomicrobiales bacterium]